MMPESTGSPSIKYHRWVVLVQIGVDVIRNEDGEFSGRLPKELELDTSSTFTTDQIVCANCQNLLLYGWGKECDAVPNNG